VSWRARSAEGGALPAAGFTWDQAASCAQEAGATIRFQQVIDGVPVVGGEVSST
jgi:hypothetical protein